MKRILTGLAALVLAWAMTAGAQAAELAVESKSCLLMEKTTGQVLYAVNEHEPLEPASVTKVMTILLTMEAIDSGSLSYDDTVTASAYACSMGGSQIWLKENEQLTVEDMLKAVCVVSANDASVALAEHLAGSAEAFVEQMNQRAAELGMADTHFVNPTGLPAKGHVTSAHDIALMSRELILNHPDIRRFTTIWTDSLRDGAFGLSNTNKLIRFYPGATGLKTGSTDAALYCLSATAERDGMELISVVMGAPTSTQRFEGAKVLLNYGFAAYGLAQAQPPQPLAPIPVILGDQAAVTPRLAEDPTILAPKEKLAAMEVEVQMAESLSAPVDAGAEVGRMTVTSNGETLASIPLTADAAVARLSYWQIFQRCLQKAFLAQ
ncbi:MAG: D-alanyl-D-alanine carboxypeptidase [Oscillospiraceae bacterium]|jgi:D-alanyl-D-alanine carboxypeptidase (penicillin-binding protein 5/6)|nr:D-alanyl-D-alanine carboxypeptidase [Oscillospiraceae bacterium]MCI8758001.1 D-alanyl-D-alanine carboxypeptidase [Oscillospiraceae bacterium]MCI9562427.1 D-alanyl-D-alanine carboxypeptidase [Oscillospiraceae bacterium]